MIINHDVAQRLSILVNLSNLDDIPFKSVVKYSFAQGKSRALFTNVVKQGPELQVGDG